jgi:trans-aconitate 2-methyltransferase
MRCDSQPAPAMNYFFGDNNVAIERLERLAGVFEPATEPFLQDLELEIGPDLTVSDVLIDLGCGPGFTTRLLAEVFDRDAIGLDSSQAQIAAALTFDEQLGVTFEAHDVTQLPFPAPPAAMIFARFLMAHLDDPERRLLDWAQALRPGGIIALDEVEAIDTGLAPFMDYLNLVAQGLNRRGSELYIGSDLAGLDLAPTLVPIYSEVRTFEVADSDAAAMFRLNLPTLRQDPEVIKKHGEDFLDRLQADLDLIATDDGNGRHIRWKLRQIAWRRPG